MKITKQIFAVLMTSMYCLAVYAEEATVIIISEGNPKGRPIAVAPFEWKGMQSQPPQDMAKIIGDDLERSGIFKPIERAKFQSNPSLDGKVNFANWRIIKSESLLIGRITDIGADNYEVAFALYDVFRQKRLLPKDDSLGGIRYKVKKSRLRGQAHVIADKVFEELTGDPGAFNTQLAYVQHTPGMGNPYFLYVTDADGYNRRKVLESPTPILSPSWSRDGEHVAYSRKSGRSWQVTIQNLYSGQRKLLSDLHPQLKNARSVSAPSWSPDSSKLAFTMSKNNNYDIYVAGVKSGFFKRITTHFEVDTEPTWMPDGKSLVFTSSRGGSPQLYRKSISGGSAKRLTFEGKYNARATISPDGRNLVFVHGKQNTYHIGLLDMERGSFNLLTTELDTLYESPSFAPNGLMIVYTAGKIGGKYTPLKVLSVDGRANFSIKALEKDDIREPAWSYFLSK